MNLKGKLTSAQTLTGTQSIAGGGSTPTGDVTWSQVKNKPFSRVDTTGGLAIYDNTLMIDTLDKIATIDYVDEQIADIDLSDYATKSELDAVEAEIPSLTGYATEQYVDTAISNIPDPTWNDIQNKPTFATVATSGDYNDLSNKPTIPSIDGLATETYVNDAIAAIDIPEDVSELNNDVGYITSSALNGYATETYVDNAVDGITTTLETDYATKAELADVDDEIPHADNITIIDNNGVWSAASTGVDIDNKSIIKNQDDELQEAVPLYTEVISHQVGGDGLNIHNYKGNGTTDGEFYLDTNETQLTFVSQATGSNIYYNVVIFGADGWISAKWRNYTGITYNCVIEDASSNFSSKIGQQIQCYYRYQQNSTYFPNGNHYGVIFHIYSSQLSPFTQWTDFLIYPTADGIAAGDTLETQCETLGLDWAQGVWNEQYISKLPNQYLNIKSDEIISYNYNPMLYTDANGDIRAKRLGAGTNISLGSINLADGTQGYQINCTLQLSPIGGNYYQNGSYGFGGNIITIDSTHWYSFINTWSGFFNNSGWGPGDYIYETGYVGGNYGIANPFKMTGLIHVGTTVDDVSIEGFETIIDHVSYNSSQDRLEFYFKEGIRPYNPYSTIYKYIGNMYKDIQRVNSIWLPLDNSTIIRDTTNGNIKTAIPAPPTTDGTYTLQVVVSNGEPTYSWI